MILMGLRIYWELCGVFMGYHALTNGLQKSLMVSEHLEDKRYEIWWDIPIQTTVKLEHYRPDVVVLNHEDNECIIVDFSVPWETNIRS